MRGYVHVTFGIAVGSCVALSSLVGLLLWRRQAARPTHVATELRAAPRPQVEELPVPATATAERAQAVFADEDCDVVKAAPRGSPIAVDAPLVECLDSVKAALKREALAKLVAKYGDSPEYEDFISAARREYKEARAEANRLELRSPVAGVVTVAAKEGELIRRGGKVAEVAAALELVVEASVVEGAGSSCRAELFDQALIVEGVRARGEAGRTRSFSFWRFPSKLRLGKVGRARVVCASE